MIPSSEKTAHLALHQSEIVSKPNRTNDKNWVYLVRKKLYPILPKLLQNGGKKVNKDEFVTR